MGRRAPVVAPPAIITQPGQEPSEDDARLELQRFLGPPQGKVPAPPQWTNSALHQKRTQTEAASATARSAPSSPVDDWKGRQGPSLEDAARETERVLSQSKADDKTAGEDDDAVRPAPPVLSTPTKDRPQGGPRGPAVAGLTDLLPEQLHELRKIWGAASPGRLRSSTSHDGLNVAAAAPACTTPTPSSGGLCMDKTSAGLTPMTMGRLATLREIWQDAPPERRRRAVTPDRPARTTKDRLTD